MEHDLDNRELLPAPPGPNWFQRQMIEKGITYAITNDNYQLGTGVRCFVCQGFFSRKKQQDCENFQCPTCNRSKDNKG